MVDSAPQTAKGLQWHIKNGCPLVLLRLYFNDEGIVKLAFAPGKGKKELYKRRAIREEEDKREAQRVMRLKNLKKGRKSLRRLS